MYIKAKIMRPQSRTLTNHIQALTVYFLFFFFEAIDAVPPLVAVQI